MDEIGWLGYSSRENVKSSRDMEEGEVEMMKEWLTGTSYRYGYISGDKFNPGTTTAPDQYGILQYE